MSKNKDATQSRDEAKINMFVPVFQQRLDKNLATARSILATEGRNGTRRHVLKYALREAKSMKRLIKEIRPVDMDKTVADLKDEIARLKEMLGKKKD